VAVRALAFVGAPIDKMVVEIADFDDDPDDRSIVDEESS
jgi:hypothetical protein